MAVFDHLLSPRYKTADNILRCSKKCEATAHIYIRNIASCELIADHGANSERLTASIFQFKENDETPKFNEQWPNPIYLYSSSNILANGLVTIIPDLAKIIFPLGWSEGFQKFSIISEEDYEADIAHLANVGASVMQHVETQKQQEMMDIEDISEAADFVLQRIAENQEAEQRQQADEIADIADEVLQQYEEEQQQQ